MRVSVPVRCLIPVCLTLLLPSMSIAQKAPAAQPQVASDLAGAYPNEPGLILNRTSVIRMQADGTGTRDYTISVRVQTDAMARQLSVIAISYPSSSEKAEYLYARVRHADGTLTETPIAGAMEQPEQVTREAPFYSDLKSLQLPIRGLGVGDTLEWSARFIISKPEIANQFWGQDTMTQDGIALNEVVELHVPATKTITLWTNPELQPPVDTQTGSERVIRWTGKHLQPSVGAEAEAAKKLTLTPEQQLSSRKGALPSLAWTTFPDWTAVGTWYQSLETDRTVSTPEIAAKVAELTAGKTTEQEKAFALYQYVATQVHYVGVAFGVGRYKPHTAAEVLSNQYGDCKDKHTLLAAMLQSIGLHPDAVLVGAGIRFNKAVPSPAAFNHLVTTVNLNGKQVWLDTTAEVAPWNTLLPQIRDQEALVIPAIGRPLLERTPALPPFPPYATLTATESLNASFTSDAHITLTFHDDDEIVLRAVLRQLSPAQYPDFLQKFVGSMGFGGTTSEPEISPVNDLNQPLVISYRYKRVKEEAWGADRVTEPFWPSSLPVVDEKNPPVAPLELGTPRTETSTVTMQLPQGWSAEVPEATHAKSAYATADTTFHLKGNELVAERKVVILAARVPTDEWKAYSKWVTDSEVGTYPFIQLLPGKDGQPAKASLSTSPAAGQNAAEALITEAGEAVKSGKPEEARGLLDKARALNPKAIGLWWQYAFVSYQLGEMHQALEEATKETAYHPEEAGIYGFLADLQHRQGQDAAARISLQKWAAAAPDDWRPAAALMHFYAQQKRVSEGIQVGSDALNRLEKTSADTSSLRLELATLEQSAGRRQEAAEIVQPLVSKVSDPSQENSVAYTLADAKVDLPHAEVMEKEVLTKLDSESQSWTLDESTSTLSRQSALLVACWDTLGWIYFQQGRLQESSSYIRAAWLNLPNGEVASHLHAVNAALHQGTPEERRSDQERRTLPLSSANGKHGTREVKLLLGEGKVLRVESVPSGTGGIGEQEASDLVANADVHALIPQGSAAHLVRQGIVNCAGATCTLVLFPMGR